MNNDRLRQERINSPLTFLFFRKHSQKLISVCIILFLSFSYVSTLAKGLTWANGGADGGDLITAAATGGVAHPGGYPLYLSIAWFFQKIPIGSLAYRTNLMSVVCMVLAVVLVFYTVNTILAGKRFAEFSSLVSAMAFGLSPMVWSQAVITEVYALQTLLTIFILYQILNSNRRFAGDFIRGLVAGMALGNHLTSIFLLPLLFWQQGSLSGQPLRRLSIRFIGVFIGSLIYIILPIRALSQPPVNWYNPLTVKSFYSLVSGDMYQTYFSLDFIAARLRGCAGVFIEQVGLPGLLIGFYYLTGGMRKNQITAALMWVFIIYGLFSILYATNDSYIYLIPSLLVFCLWIGCGIQESMLQIATMRWKALSVLTTLLVVAALVYQGVRVAPLVDASHDTRAEDFGRMAMKTLPEGAVVFTKDDESTFALWYFHFGLKQRNDIAIISEGLLPYDWYIDNLRVTYPGLSIPRDGEVSATLIVGANPFRTVCTAEEPNATGKIDSTRALSWMNGVYCSS